MLDSADLLNLGARLGDVLNRVALKHNLILHVRRARALDALLRVDDANNLYTNRAASGWRA